MTGSKAEGASHGPGIGEKIKLPFRELKEKLNLHEAKVQLIHKK